MQPIAAWLVARPHNGVIGLAATLLLPFINVFSGIFMVLLVLKNGPRTAVLQAGAAAGILALASLLTGTAVTEVAVFAVMVWGSAALLGIVLQRTRSLTLTLQVVALVLVTMAIAIFGFVPDIVEFAKPLTTFYLEFYRASGLSEQAEILASQPLALAAELLRITLWVAWVFWVAYTLFGYRFYRRLEDPPADFGSFRELDFGRVIAIGMAIATLVAYLAGLDWLQNVAFVMIAIFALQGLAIAHFVFDAGILPLFLLILVYILLVMPVLNDFVIVGLAAFGFSDVWVRFRPRIVAKQQERNL